MGGTATAGRAARCLRWGAICLLAAGLGTSAAGARTLNDAPRISPAKAVVRPQRSALCPNADAPATSASVSEMSAAVDCLINQQRLRFGLAPMEVSAALNHSAQRWTDRMVATGRFTHGGQTAFGQRLLAAGFNWGQAGENIATGFLTPRDAVAGWMASPDHCRNILDPSFREMGTGESPAPVGSFATGAATWTQDMGLLMGQTALSHNQRPQKGCPYTVASSPR